MKAAPAKCIAGTMPAGYKLSSPAIHVPQSTTKDRPPPAASGEDGADLTIVILSGIVSRYDMKDYAKIALIPGALLARSVGLRT